MLNRKYSKEKVLRLCTLHMEFACNYKLAFSVQQAQNSSMFLACFIVVFVERDGFKSYILQHVHLFPLSLRMYLSFLIDFCLIAIAHK